MRVSAPGEIAQLVALNCEPERVEHVRAMIAGSGMLLRGHFQLQSGVHSEYFVRARGLAARTALLDAFAQELLNLIPGHASDTVLCPESAGFVIGAAVAAVAGIGLAVTRTDLHRRPSSELRTGNIQPLAVVLLVNDVATSGSSLTLLHRAARHHGGVVRAALTLAKIGGTPLKATNDLRIKGHWLIEGLWPLFPKERCELCHRGVPLILSEELG